MIEKKATVDTERASRIISVRRVATGILIVLVCIFVITLLYNDPPVYILLIRAMAEAGMVGGLADWFAVEALFRRPLGLPVPHTALLPANQKRVAKNIGRFFDDYFMVPEQLAAQFSKINPIKLIARWLAVPENAKSISIHLSSFLQIFIGNQLRGGKIIGSSKLISNAFITSVDSERLAESIASLIQKSLRGAMLDGLLERIGGAIDENREKVIELVQERSRWWVAPAIDQKIAMLLVDGVLSVIDELANEGTELRRDFENSIGQMIDQIHKDGSIVKYIEQGKKQFVKTSDFAEVVENLLASIIKKAEQGLKQDPDKFANLLAEPICRFSNLLLERQDLQDELNAKIAAGIGKLSVNQYITQTISGWDSAMLVSRIEMEVGRDIQFIRINGAILGALVGGLLFGIIFVFQ